MSLEEERNQNKFLTHLTKDCNGQDAIFNLISILESGVIYARKCHNFHRDLIWKSGLKSEDYASFRKFDTVSFTSRFFTINKLVQYKRENHHRFSSIFSEFGVVFSSQKIWRNGGKKIRTLTDGEKINPRENVKRRVAKIKNYKYKKCALNESLALARDTFNIDIDGRNYSHTYEQEYRHLGDFHFKLEQIKAILVKNRVDFLAALRKKNECLYKEIISLERKNTIVITHPKFVGKIL